MRLNARCAGGSASTRTQAWTTTGAWTCCRTTTCGAGSSTSSTAASATLSRPIRGAIRERQTPYSSGCETRSEPTFGSATGGPIVRRTSVTSASPSSYIPRQSRSAFVRSLRLNDHNNETLSHVTTSFQGAFIYNKAHRFIGRSRIFPRYRKRLTYAMSRQKIKRVSQANQPCNVSTSLAEWKTCLLMAFDDMAQCQLPWRYQPHTSFRWTRLNMDYVTSQTCTRSTA